MSFLKAYQHDLVPQLGALDYREVPTDHYFDTSQPEAPPTDTISAWCGRITLKGLAIVTHVLKAPYPDRGVVSSRQPAEYVIRTDVHAQEPADPFRVPSPRIAALYADLGEAGMAYLDEGRADPHFKDEDIFAAWPVRLDINRHSELWQATASREGLYKAQERVGQLLSDKENQGLSLAQNNLVCAEVNTRETVGTHIYQIFAGLPIERQPINFPTDLYVREPSTMVNLALTLLGKPLVDPTPTDS